MDAPYRGAPREIIQLTLYFSYLDDPQSLRTCSYVDRLFCALAQMLLLSRVKLRQTHIDTLTLSHVPVYSPATHFLQVLDQSPHLSTYIRSLAIQCSDWPQQNRHNRHWLETDDSLSTLLSRLVNIQSISFLPFEDKPVHQQPQVPPLMYRATAQGVDAVLSSPHALLFTCLDLRGVEEFPVELLRDCLALKHLSITSLTFNPMMSPPHSILQLDYLHIEISKHLQELAQYFTHPSFPINISCLKTLSVHPATRQTFDRLDAFSVHASSITHLHIRAKDIPVSVLYNVLNYPLELRTIAPPDLRGFLSIKSVSIDAVLRIRIFTHQSLIDYFTNPLPWIIDFFNKMAENSALAKEVERLTVNLTFVDFPPNLMKHLSWKDVVATVMAKFERPVKLSINIIGVDKNVALQLRTDEHLSNLAGRGCLSIS